MCAGTARRGAELRELNFHKKFKEGAKGRLCDGGDSFLRSLAFALCRNVYFIRISMKIQERVENRLALNFCFFFFKKKEGQKFISEAYEKF